MPADLDRLQSLRVSDVMNRHVVTLSTQQTMSQAASVFVEHGISGTPVLVINPRVMLSTADVFAGWDGVDHGALGDWRTGRNDLEKPARALVSQIETVHAWLSVQPGAWFVRMSGSGATCFAFFASEEARDSAADRVPREWWRLATHLR